MAGPSAVRERAAQLRLGDGIARLALLALSERDVQRLLEHAIIRIAEALGVEHVQVFELLPDARTLVSRASLSGDRRALSRVNLGRPTGSQASFTLHSCSPVTSEDLSRETRFRASRTQRTLGLATGVSVPLFGRSNRPYGVLEVGTGGPLCVPPETVVDFLQGAGNLLVPAVERARVEAACRFLSESESRLVSAHDFNETVVALAELAVPRLADWCCIDVVLPDGAIECVAISHSDPGITPIATGLRQQLRVEPSSEVGVARVVRTGLPEFHFDLGDALSADAGQKDALADLVAAAGFRAAIVTPLAARGHVFGAVTLVSRSARRFFDEGDVLLADAFATHAGLALDNVRLFFKKGREVPALSKMAGVTSGIGLLDPEILGTRLLTTVAEEKNRLDRVVESVVFASRVGSARHERLDESCDAVDVVRGALESIRGALPDSWKLAFDHPSVHVAGDAQTIRRIVTCLVDNAVTYSPGGGSISVRLVARRTNLRLVVEDEGIGIPPEERTLVFEKFQRGDGARTVGADGVGLGLFICRELARRLNGRIEVVAERERGTTVVVDLPLAMPEHDESNGAPEDELRARVTRRKSSKPKRAA